MQLRDNAIWISKEPLLSLTLTLVSSTVFQTGCTHPWQFPQLYKREQGCKQTIVQATIRSLWTRLPKYMPASFPGTHSQALIPRHSFPGSHSQALILRLSFPGTHSQALILRHSFPGSHSQALILRHSFPGSHSQALIPRHSFSGSRNSQALEIPRLSKLKKAWSTPFVHTWFSEELWNFVKSTQLH